MMHPHMQEEMARQHQRDLLRNHRHPQPGLLELLLGWLIQLLFKPSRKRKHHDR